MATICWDSYGVILIDYLERDQTINTDRYCVTLTRLREAIRHKRPGMLSKGQYQAPILLKQCRNRCDGSGGKSRVTPPPHTAQIWHPGTICCF
ncbi:hypothetical protein TNIN_440131 [Trichonephila inaurata madagascariensis]|uniref:Mariner Mos1 transposase n=1 Tax=Trichonephila inaurata madagascariensis TaxID=2747483 RepID=A0A8X6X0K3_9ARAC|nr:hypothetical protein TNIN_440131 [Trichonephila inaurata madagascariensis]